MFGLSVGELLIILTIMVGLGLAGIITILVITTLVLVRLAARRSQDPTSHDDG